MNSTKLYALAAAGGAVGALVGAYIPTGVGIPPSLWIAMATACAGVFAGVFIFLRTEGSREPLFEDASSIGQDIERLNEENPDWDFAGRVASVRVSLRNGASVEDMTRIYGAKVVNAAQNSTPLH